MHIYWRVISKSACFLCLLIYTRPAIGMNLSGPIAANSVDISGSVIMSSVTITTVTVTNLLNIQGTYNNVKGLVLQTKFSSTTIDTNVSTATYQPVAGLAQTIALSNVNNYVRISLSGSLSNSNCLGLLTIKRDSIDLGQGQSFAYVRIPNDLPLGITLIDLPGDTAMHTYQVFIAASPGCIGDVANFTTSPVGYLLLQEISQ